MNKIAASAAQLA